MRPDRGAGSAIRRPRPRLARIRPRRAGARGRLATGTTPIAITAPSWGRRRRRGGCSEQHTRPSADQLQTTPGGGSRRSVAVGYESSSASASLAAALMSRAATSIHCALDDGVGQRREPGGSPPRRVGHERDDPGVTRCDRLLDLVGELAAVVQLTYLAGRGAGGAQGRRAAEDRGREDDAEGDAADQAPLEPGLGAVVGGLLDLQLPVGLALDHDDALDLDRTSVLGRLECLVGAPRRRRVGEVGDDQRVGPVGRGCDELGPVVRRWGCSLTCRLLVHCAWDPARVPTTTSRPGGGSTGDSPEQPGDLGVQVRVTSHG